MVAMKNVEIIIGEGITEKYYFKSVKDAICNKPEAKPIKPYNLKELEKAICRERIYHNPLSYWYG